MTGRPSAVPPEVLVGNDGEDVFVRADLALTAPEARNVAALHGEDVRAMSAEIVVMLPRGDEWATVKDGTPGCSRYWRFRL